MSHSIESAPEIIRELTDSDLTDVSGGIFGGIFQAAVDQMNREERYCTPQDVRANCLPHPKYMP